MTRPTSPNPAPQKPQVRAPIQTPTPSRPEFAAPTAVGLPADFGLM